MNWLSMKLQVDGLEAYTVPACRSAGWFWWSRGLNALADARDFRSITRVINGGFNGFPDRLAYFDRAQTVLSC